jgi:hypothetical protein
MKALVRLPFAAAESEAAGCRRTWLTILQKERKEGKREIA